MRDHATDPFKNAYFEQQAAAEATVHACPPLGQGVTPCCGKTPFELPRADRMTENLVDVTCGKRVAESAESADHLAERLVNAGAERRSAAILASRRTKPERPLFDGDDPLFAHMKWNINRRCDGCSAPYSIVRASTYALVTDLKPDMLRELYKQHGGPPPTVDLVQGKAVHLGTQAACASCEREFYRALAAGHSWVFVDLLVPPPALRKGALSISVPRIVATA